MKYIIVSGGVISGIGKGTVCSSIGLILKSRGYVVTHIKIDPYLNYSASMMAPCEHGEVYVLNDGGETDLDLGNYERFSSVEMTTDNAITGGKIFYNLIKKEMKGEFGGKTLQMNPHLVNEIISRIEKVSNTAVRDFNTGQKNIPDFIVVELGGTVGEFESLMFLEAFYKFTRKLSKQDYVHISVDYLIDLHGVEHKTKPIQNSNLKLRSFGLCNDIIVCRTQVPVENTSINKIAENCNVSAKNIFYLPNLSTVYKVPSYLISIGLLDCLKESLNFNDKCVIKAGLDKFEQLAKRHNDTINIGVITKYGSQDDSYATVVHSLLLSSSEVGVNVNICWIDAELFEENYELALSKIKDCNGVLVPGGFGTRGIEGKIKAITYCRENKIPFLGICLGLQLSIIEFARNVLKIENATSEEFNPKGESLFITYIDFNGIKKKTLRLGANNIVLSEKSKISRIYDSPVISERHRHRFEINRQYISQLEERGYVCVGRSEKDDVPEIFENIDHPFFIGVQFHPEFNARPLSPSPLFTQFIHSSYNIKE